MEFLDKWSHPAAVLPRWRSGGGAGGQLGSLMTCPSVQIPGSRRAGHRAPADLLVIGDDDSTVMSCTDPMLATVRQSLQAIANAPSG